MRANPFRHLRRCSQALIALLAATGYAVCHAIAGQPGTLDTTFAGSGIASDAGIIGASIALQGDGKLLIGGHCTVGGYVFCALRYRSDGTVDTSFGSAGKAAVDVTSMQSLVHTVISLPGSKVLLAGFCINNGSYGSCIVRLNNDGTLDTTFGTAGKVLAHWPNATFTPSRAVRGSDGKYLVSGDCTFSGTPAFCVLRYLADGGVDVAFGNGGLVQTSIVAGVSGASATATALAVQSDQRVIVAGTCAYPVNFSSRNHFCALRLMANGQIDTSFGTGGVLVPSSAQNDQLADATVQPDGTLVVSGACSDMSSSLFCTRRFLANGAPDARFGNNGTVMTALGSGVNFWLGAGVAVRPQADGKLVVAGQCYNNTARDLCIARYHSDGTLDTGFGAAGKVITTVSAGDDEARALAIRPDGKLLVVGLNSTATHVLRYDGGPFGYRDCSPDIDGDGSALATTDGLILLRAMLGFEGASAIAGVSFASHASRTTWPSIRDHLVTQCGMPLAQ